MLEAWMANNMINRLQRMEQIGNQVETFNMAPAGATDAVMTPMENSIVLRREDYPQAFNSLDANGNMTFSLSGKF